MNVVSKILGVILIANAVLCLAGLFSHGFHWHLGLGPVLKIGLPLCLLAAGVLQFAKPKAALVALIIMFPVASILVHFTMLPAWPLFRFLPQSLVLPTLLTSNALAVIMSMWVWLFTRRELHTQALKSTS